MFDIPVSVLFGVIAMLAWGVADFLAAASVRKLTELQVAFMSQIVILAIFIPAALIFFPSPQFTVSDILWVILGGVIDALGLLAFFKGLKVGKVAVVAPIATSASIVTVLISILFLGEQLRLPQAASILFVIAGSILISFRLNDLRGLHFDHAVKGAHYAFIAMILWGIGIGIIGHTVHAEPDWLPLVLISNLAILATFILYGKIKGRKLSAPLINARLPALVGISEAIAFAAFGFGSSMGSASIIVPIIGTAPAVSVVLARVFFNEKTEINQKLGLLFIIYGIVTLSIV